MIDQILEDVQNIGRGAVLMMGTPAGWIAVALIVGFGFLVWRRSRHE